MVEVINGVKNIKNVNIGKGLTSSPIIKKDQDYNQLLL